MTDMMTAWVLEGPGEPSAFRKVKRVCPNARPDWVVVRVRAFGLNRSELFSRRGLSSEDFSFPRVLGLEGVGEVLDPGDSDLTEGDRVACLMGGMGRSFDGSYATHVCVPRKQVFRANVDLAWDALGAFPETYNTAYGVCVEALRLEAHDRVLIRGGTSALGLAAASIAQDIGCDVVTTTRNERKVELLAERAQARVILDGPDFAERVLTEAGPRTAVVECVGAAATVETSCATMTEGGRLGLVGQLSESWDTDAAPRIPDGIESSFTRSDLVEAPRDDDRMATIFKAAQAGRYRTNLHRVFSFDELPNAHAVMGANESVGKLVVRSDA